VTSIRDAGTMCDHVRVRTADIFSTLAYVRPDFVLQFYFTNWTVTTHVWPKLSIHIKNMKKHKTIDSSHVERTNRPTVSLQSICSLDTNCQPHHELNTALMASLTTVTTRTSLLFAFILGTPAT